MIPSKYFKLLCITGVLFLTFSACKKDDPQPTPEVPTGPDPQPTPEVPTGPSLVFKFKFDEDQERLGNIGLPVTMPSNHAGQSPNFNGISAHYIELAPEPWTQLGTGDVLYVGPETDAGGATALDFDQAIITGEDEEFIRIPFSEITPGLYKWIRVSLSYQNYDIEYMFAGTMYSGTVASFIGFNNYISSYQIKNEIMQVNDNKLQGFWGFETTVMEFTQTIEGQAPEGATTVPNPLFGQADIPDGSCVVTGPFNNHLTITGEETEDIVIVLSLSTNDSFEWIDVNSDGKYEPLDANFDSTGEVPVDMGVRGLEAIVLE